MVFAIFNNIVFSVSLLTMAAYLLTKVRLIRRFVASDIKSLWEKIAMGIFFGLLGIMATYGGIPVEGAIANARVIAVIMGGILGGPFVGVLAGLIAGIHRYAIDIGGLTALACALSTITEGLIGGIASDYIKKHRTSWHLYGLVTLVAETAQMAIILMVARPFSQALILVRLIAAPMILFNSIGVMIFANILEAAFMEQDKEAARKIKLVLNIADRCLPYLRKGLRPSVELDQANRIILEMSDISGVMITDTQSVLSCAGSDFKGLKQSVVLPDIVRQTMALQAVLDAEDTSEDDPLYPLLRKYAVVCAPLIQRGGEVVGCLCLFIRKFILLKDVEREFASGLAKVFSTQLELSQIDYQRELLRKAEFHALQSQINPHFLFNALTTITMFCREKPDRARELLLDLSQYFRNTLRRGQEMISIQDELSHVHAYLELEKARFEDRLIVEEDILPNLNCILPSFILQPLVENAIRHGSLRHAQKGWIRIKARKYRDYTFITVTDNGMGISPEIQEQLFSGTMPETSVGLANVQKRLLSIYGEHNGLKIKSRPGQCMVALRIPDQILTGETT